MANFPQTMNYTGFNTPSRIEADIADLVHEGSIPPELNGAFYRVQPDPQFPPRLGDDISFNGDGMITRFHLHDGQCDFRQRWAKTDKWKLENEAGKALFGAYRNPLTDDESVKGRYRSTANTNAWIHGGKLYALKEDSPALVMDAATMETEGFTHFFNDKTGQKMTGQTFTAHPKIDPKTGNMIAFGYASTGLCTDDCTFYEVTPEGELVHEIWFKVPYYCMMHDFGITEDYAVFNIMPSIGSWERLEKGLPHFGFDTSMPVYLGVLPRREGATGDDIRWFKTEQQLQQPCDERLSGGEQSPFRHSGGEEQHVPLLPGCERRALQRAGGDELPHPLDGRYGEQQRRL
jgi:carotenoid cleavage dioxygenase-like enzyme